MAVLILTTVSKPNGTAFLPEQMATKNRLLTATASKFSEDISTFIFKSWSA